MSNQRDDVDLVDYEEPPSCRSPRHQRPQVALGEINPSYLEDNASGSVSIGTAGSLSGTVTPVYYGSSGKISRENVVVERCDGTRVIVTPDRLSVNPPERHIKERDLKFLRIFSIIAIFLFPPSGIAALVYARRTEKQFHKGLERGDMDLAKKYSKTCERLLIMSLVCGLLMYGLILAVVEKTTYGKKHWQSTHTFNALGGRSP